MKVRLQSVGCNLQLAGRTAPQPRSQIADARLYPIKLYTTYTIVPCVHDTRYSCTAVRSCKRCVHGQSDSSTRRFLTGVSHTHADAGTRTCARRHPWRPCKSCHVSKQQTSAIWLVALRGAPHMRESQSVAGDIAHCRSTRVKKSCGKNADGSS